LDRWEAVYDGTSAMELYFASSFGCIGIGVIPLNENNATGTIKEEITYYLIPEALKTRVLQLGLYVFVMED
jgi:hypothetical protein